MNKVLMEKLDVLIKLLSKGMHFEKTVRKCTNSSGAIYMHKKYIDKKFDVYLIPKEEKIERETAKPLPQDIEEKEI